MTLGISPSKVDFLFYYIDYVPCIVWVLPEPVWPYANIVLWYPSMALSIMCSILQPVYTSSWELSSANK